jgi:hypothetical protein
VKATHVRLQRGTRIVLACGVLYGVALSVLAWTVPVGGSSETSSSGVVTSAGVVHQQTTLIHHAARTTIQRNGPEVLWLVLGVPLAVVGLVLAELRWCRRWGHPGPGGVSIVLAAALLLLVVAGAFSVGPTALPLLMVVVCASASEYNSRQTVWAPPLLPPPPPPPRPAGVSPPAPWGG